MLMCTATFEMSLPQSIAALRPCRGDQSKETFRLTSVECWETQGELVAEGIYAETVVGKPCEGVQV